MKNKTYLILIFLLGVNFCVGQSLKIDKRQTIDDFYNHTLIDVNVVEDGYTVLGMDRGESGYNYHFYITKLNRDLEVTSQTRLAKDADVHHYFGDIVYGDESIIFGLGHVDKEPNEMLDFAVGFDANNDLRFNVLMEEKHEGSIKGFWKNGLLHGITNNNSNYLIHTFSKDGELIETKVIDNGYAETLMDLILCEDYFFIYGWSIENNQSRFDIIKLDYKCNVLGKVSERLEETPISINKLKNNNLAIIFETTPSTLVIFDSNLQKIENITHIRHDYKYRYVRHN
jgi:hypothetical protein